MGLTDAIKKQYEARKKREGKHRLLDQNDPVSTAEKIGKEQHVSAPTVKRAGGKPVAIVYLLCISTNIEVRIKWG